MVSLIGLFYLRLTRVVTDKSISELRDIIRGIPELNGTLTSRRKDTLIEGLQAYERNHPQETDFDLNMSFEDDLSLTSEENELQSGTQRWVEHFIGLNLRDEYIVSSFFDPITFSTIKKILPQNIFRRWKHTFEHVCRTFWGDCSPELPITRSGRPVKMRRLNAAAFARRIGEEQGICQFEPTPEKRTTRTLEGEINHLWDQMLMEHLKQPFPFWRSIHREYVWLAPIARYYLSIPSSSAEAERTFSASGKLLCKSRVNLGKDVARSMLYLQVNVLRKKFKVLKRSDPLDTDEE